MDRWTSEIILISDNEHAIPVQVNRNGIRSIAVGVGDIHRLNLPFLTIESDVKPDDLLVSSGLDGIFPAGYPVARILKVERNPAETFAVVEARPMAQLDRAREVLLLWFDKSTPMTGTVPSDPTRSPAGEISSTPTYKPATPQQSRTQTSPRAQPPKPAAPPAPAEPTPTTPARTDSAEPARAPSEPARPEAATPAPQEPPTP